ncbi:MAG: hypothetical protein JXC36_05480 [Candidatus Atribacteria bacterium]|nr:hypothetical protein [Candidatus Atribacteria bacterium]
MNVIKWIARIIAMIIIVIGLPFYFGYGNPLPFAKHEYIFYDNLWLTVFPMMFIGLALGLKYEKIGGYLIVISLLIGFLASFFMGKGSSLHLLISFVVGILYLVVGYYKSSKKIDNSMMKDRKVNR